MRGQRITKHAEPPTRVGRRVPSVHQRNTAR